MRKKRDIISSAVWDKIPLAVTLVLLLLPYALPFAIKPLYALAPIYFFATIKDDTVDFIPIMLFAFIKDFMDGTPFGLHIFLFLSVYFIIRYQPFYPAGENFKQSFIGFAAVSVALGLLKYLFIYSLYTKEMGFGIAAADCAATIALYPILYPFLVWVEFKKTGGWI